MALSVRPLHMYEPQEEFEPPEYWSSLRPAQLPQVTVEPPAEESDNGPYRRMLVTVLEVLDGRRPIGQLRSLLAPAVFEATLTRLCHLPPGLRYQLRSVHSCRIGDDAVELCGRIETRTPAKRRAQAITARLERRRTGWRCVFLRIL